MIHYHGTPITPNTACAQVLRGRHGLVSFRHPMQQQIVADVCSSFILDNGAFSAWRAGKPVENWEPYYEWVTSWARHPGFDWAVIPDVIDGDEEANNALLLEWRRQMSEHPGVPVWHLHEPLERLQQMSYEWPRVALGSSGQYSRPGGTNWWVRMMRAMEAVCDDGRPRCKLHGLRMLNPDIFTRLPLASADSANVGRNVGLDKAWRGTYTPHSKAWRGLVLAERIESHQSAAKWSGNIPEDEPTLLKW